ncbi:DUF2066 domain-containing protein [Sneathiella chinensis]|uniref:DUF2066 domain-containing protein n=1 Tax=Sneathiella chinensis TaxID=349750 RepID=A0ABQ5U5J6_9PROT|nr:DUF2066 domain-containing protein [Sneathiella chinensis]GLQ07036.1 hypothetical protein GCM10007924_22570 [Sneathiella chinensis]
MSIKPTLAAQNNLYTIRGISVDVTAGSASEARSVALQQGQKRAFEALLRKVTPKSHHDTLPSIADSEITGMVAGIQVANEKTSATRYLADLTFEFRREQVVPILKLNSLPYSETISKPLIVLPVFNSEGGRNLWDEPNPWRDEWLAVFEGGEKPEGSLQRQDDWVQTRLQPVVVPAGTLEDIQAISAEQAVALDPAALEELQSFYNAKGVLVALATLTVDGGVRRLDVSYQRSDVFTTAVIESFTGGDEDRDVFRAAIFDVVGTLQEDWKDQTVLDTSIENRIAVSSRIESLNDWLDIQSRAREIPAIQEIMVREVSVGQAFWEISFVGQLEQLQGALAQRDLVLENINGFWALEKKAN